MAKPKIFVSHSTKDNEFAMKLVADLNAAGADAWMDTNYLGAGNFLQRIDELLADCEWFLLVLTRNAIASDRIRWEVNAAALRLNQGAIRDLIFIQVEPINHNELPGFWRASYILDATMGYAGVRHALLRDLGLSSPSLIPSSHFEDDSDLIFDDSDLIFSELRELRELREVLTATHEAGDDGFQVTAFHPWVAQAGSRENTLLVYAHIPSSLEDVRKNAQGFDHRLGDESKETAGPNIESIPRGTEITFVPKVNGITFSPESASFRWTENWHRVIFTFEPSMELSGDVAKGEIEVYATTDAGRLPISCVTLAMSFRGKPTSPLASDRDVGTYPGDESKGFRFQRIFASYAHEDVGIVRNCCRAYMALGIIMHIDYLSLLSGQYVPSAIMTLIDSSDVFQLYWSPHAAASSWVRLEWEYALGLDREEGFIRPLYWEDSLPTVPLRLGPFHFAKLE